MGAGTIQSSDSVRRRQAAGELTGRLRDFGKRRKAVAAMRGAFWLSLGAFTFLWFVLLAARLAVENAQAKIVELETLLDQAEEKKS